MTSHWGCHCLHVVLREGSQIVFGLWKKPISLNDTSAQRTELEQLPGPWAANGAFQFQPVFSRLTQVWCWDKQFLGFASSEWRWAVAVPLWSVLGGAGTALPQGRELSQSPGLHLGKGQGKIQGAEQCCTKPLQIQDLPKHQDEIPVPLWWAL